MNKSESIKNLAMALNKAQAEMGGAAKDANNPFFKSKYADLGSVIRAIKEPFASNGLSYSQFPISEADTVGVDTILMHSSGEWIESRLLLPMVKADPQKAGSAITYARRYALAAIVGIATEDDDAEDATRRKGKGKAEKVKTTYLGNKVKPGNEEQKKKEEDRLAKEKKEKVVS